MKNQKEILFFFLNEYTKSETRVSKTTHTAPFLVTPIHAETNCEQKYNPLWSYTCYKYACYVHRNMPLTFAISFTIKAAINFQFN